MYEDTKACGCGYETNDSKTGNHNNGYPTTLTSTMEVAGVESIPGADVQPPSIGLSCNED